MDAKQKAIVAARLADEKKADDIVVLDLEGICSFTDIFVVCTGSTGVQLRAIAECIAVGLREAGIPKPDMDGARQGNWVVMDYGDVVVHIMTADSRDYYRLEALWGDGQTLDWAAGPAAAAAGA